MCEEYMASPVVREAVMTRTQMMAQPEVAAQYREFDRVFSQKYESLCRTDKF